MTRGMLCVLLASLLLSLLAVSSGAAPLDAFLPPRPNLYAATSDLIPAAAAPDATACAQRCLDYGAACISINLCTNGTSFACGIQGWSISYEHGASPTCSWYRRVIARDDALVGQAIPWQLVAPAPRSVTLLSGPLHTAFENNVAHYLHVRDPADMLYFFAKRAGVAAPNGSCWGWGGWIHGSEAGNYMMGAGSALRWRNDTLLGANVQRVVDGIARYRDNHTGWLWAFDEADIWSDNLPDYCASWVTRGLLDAHAAGVEGALDVARASISLFNNHSALPFFLPANGGPAPVQPYPSGFNNVTNGGYGQATGHTIYMQNQGMIKHSLMALTEAGTRADVDAAGLYVEVCKLSVRASAFTFSVNGGQVTFCDDTILTHAEAVRMVGAPPSDAGLVAARTAVGGRLSLNLASAVLQSQLRGHCVGGAARPVSSVGRDIESFLLYSFTTPTMSPSPALPFVPHLGTSSQGTARTSTRCCVRGGCCGRTGFFPAAPLH